MVGEREWGLVEVIYARKVSTAPSITISPSSVLAHPSNLAHAIFLCCRWVGLFTPLGEVSTALGNVLLLKVNFNMCFL